MYPCVLVRIDSSYLSEIVFKKHFNRWNQHFKALLIVFKRGLLVVEFDEPKRPTGINRRVVKTEW